jgi:hypothetical protein
MQVSAVDHFESAEKTRVKFAVKVLRALQFSEAHRDQIARVGVAWWPDGRHFIAHPKILGPYLSLKSNSVNTNFRDHGFALAPCAVNQIISRFGNLPDPQNWKKRVHSSGEFTRSTTAEQASRIPLCKKRTLGRVTATDSDADDGPESACAIPSVLGLVLSGARHIQTSVTTLIQKAEGVRCWKEAVVAAVAGDWVTAFGCVPSIAVEHLLDSLLAPPPGLAPEALARVRANIGYLALAGGRADRVAFDDFLLLMLRYGPRARIVATMLDLAGGQGRPPCFQPWFCPDMAARAAEAVLASQRRTAWIVRPSAAPNAFTLHCKMLGRIVAAHIRYDGHAHAGQALSVVLDSEMKCAASWPELLFRELELRIEDAPVAALGPDQGRWPEADRGWRLDPSFAALDGR